MLSIEDVQFRKAHLEVAGLECLDPEVPGFLAQLLHVLGVLGDLGGDVGDGGLAHQAVEPGLGGGLLDGKKTRVYCLLGDGECQEGSVWESAMAAAHFKVSKLMCFVDRNGFSLDGPTEKIMALDPLDKKFEDFGWKVLTIDGHDFDAICEAIETGQQEREKPVMIIAKTTKGKGVDFMESKTGWHYGGLDDEMKKKALDSIQRRYPD